MSLQRPIESAKSYGSIPRSIRQVQDAKDKHAKSAPDPIDSVSIMMVAERGSDAKFIRRFTITDDSYSIALYTNEQIQFLVDNPDVTIHVDTTFNLSETPTYIFSVVTTLRANQFQGDPLLLGPILLTTRQRKKDYVTLWHSICGHDVKISRLKIFVTDGELALTNSIEEFFPEARLVRCMLHLPVNCLAKARESFPEAIVKQIMTYTNQLMASEPATFQNQVDAVMKKIAELAKTEGCEIGRASCRERV